MFSGNSVSGLKPTSIQRQCGDAGITTALVGRMKTLLPRAIKSALSLSPTTSVQFAERRVCEISFNYFNKMTKGQNPLAWSVEILRQFSVMKAVIWHLPSEQSFEEISAKQPLMLQPRYLSVWNLLNIECPYYDCISEVFDPQTLGS